MSRPRIERTTLGNYIVVFTVEELYYVLIHPGLLSHSQTHNLQIWLWLAMASRRITALA